MIGSNIKLPYPSCAIYVAIADREVLRNSMIFLHSYNPFHLLYQTRIAGITDCV